MIDSISSYTASYRTTTEQTTTQSTRPARTGEEQAASERAWSGRATAQRNLPDRTLRTTASPAVQPRVIEQRPALQRDQVTLTGEQVLTAPAYAGTYPRTERDDMEYQYEPV